MRSPGRTFWHWQLEGKAPEDSPNILSRTMRRSTLNRACIAAQDTPPGAVSLELLPARDPAATGQAAAPTGRELPTELLLRVLELLPPNEQTLSGRLACKDAARRLSTPRHCTVRCGQPLPEHAADECWQRHLLEQGRHMTFKHKLQLLSTAAASGCEANVRLAWGVLQPCLFPEMVSERAGAKRYPYGAYPDMDDPGTAAAKAGHAGIVAWLAAHGCPLDIGRMRQAAALHSTLEVLQGVWGLLPEPDGGALDDLALQVTYRAAQSRTPDACAKVCWLLDGHRGILSPMHLTDVLTFAADAGRFDVVRHVLNTRPGHVLSNCQGRRLLQGALQHADLAAADWLVDETGVGLPTDGAIWLWEAAARGGRADAFRWLMDRGVPPQRHALASAFKSGWPEAVRFLLEECRLEEEPWLLYSAVLIGSVELAAWLWQRGRQEPSPSLYAAAALCGSVAMVEWLMQEVRCPVDQDTALHVLCGWPSSRPGSSSTTTTSGGGSGDSSGGGGSDGNAGAAGGGAMGLLRALQLLAEAGCRLERLSVDALEQVARHGDMGLAQWVVQQAEGGRWPERAMQCIVKDWPEGGASGSQLCDAVLEAGGSPGSCREVQQAARRGDLEALRLLHGQGGLRLGREVWVAAAEGGCEAVLEWLAAEGCRVGAGAGQDPYLAAGLRGDRGVLCTLRRLGVPWGHRGVLRAAVDRWAAPPVVRWMVEEGAPWDGATVARAAKEARRRWWRYEATAVWLAQQVAARGGPGVGGAGSGGGRSRSSKRGWLGAGRGGVRRRREQEQQEEAIGS